MGRLLGRDAVAYLSTCATIVDGIRCPPIFFPYVGYRSRGEGSGHSETDDDGSGIVIRIMHSGVKGFRRSTSLAAPIVSPYTTTTPRMIEAHSRRGVVLHSDDGLVIGGITACPHGPRSAHRGCNMSHGYAGTGMRKLHIALCYTPIRREQGYRGV